MWFTCMACDLHDNLWLHVSYSICVMLAFYVMHVLQMCCCDLYDWIMWLACDLSFVGHVVCMWYWSELGDARNLTAAGLPLSSSLTSGTFTPPLTMTTASQLMLSHICYCTHCHTLTLHTSHTPHTVHFAWNLFCVYITVINSCLKTLQTLQKKSKWTFWLCAIAS